MSETVDNMLNKNEEPTSLATKIFSDLCCDGCTCKSEHAKKAILYASTIKKLIDKDSDF